MSVSSILSSLRLSARRFTDRAVKVMAAAKQEATDRGHRTVTPAHVLLGLTRVTPGPGRVALAQLGLDLPQHLDALTALIAASDPGEAGGRPVISPETEQLLAEAGTQARAMGHDYIGTEHMVLALSTVGTGPTSDFLREWGIAAEPFRQAVRELLNMR